MDKMQRKIDTKAIDAAYEEHKAFTKEMGFPSVGREIIAEFAELQQAMVGLSNEQLLNVCGDRVEQLIGAKSIQDTKVKS